MNRLDGKVALISGTAGGQGRAASLLFARAGARVVGCDRDGAGADETVRLVREAGGEMVSCAPVDLATAGGAAAFVAAGLEAYGTIDVLYNNAGATRIGPFEELTLEDWHYVLRNELDIVYLVTSAAWPHLVSGGGGSIVNTASRVAVRAPTYVLQAAHGAAKGGVYAFTLHLAAAGAPHRIRANAVLPGLIRSPGVEELVGFDAADSPVHALAAANPMGRVGRPEDVAKVALFLASDDSAYVNAEGILIDGGQSVILG